MELQELENRWVAYDLKLTENIQLNKDVLKQLLIHKPTSRLNRMSLTVGLEMILGLVLIGWFISQIGYRADWTYWLGMLLYFPLVLWGFIWTLRYFSLIRKVDFSKSVTQTRIALQELQLHKLRRIKIGYGLGPVGASGVFLLSGINVFNTHFLLPLALILMVFFTSFYIRYKYDLVQRFEKFKNELNDLEALEKD